MTDAAAGLDSLDPAAGARRPISTLSGATPWLGSWVGAGDFQGGRSWWRLRFSLLHVRSSSEWWLESSGDAMEVTKRKVRWAAVAAALVASGLALGLALWGYRDRLASIDLQAWVDRLAGYGPLPYYAAMSVLPSLWFPVSPFLVAGGAIFGLPTAIAGSAVALALNMSLSWFLAGFWLRPWFERLIGRFGYNVPQLSRGNMLRIALLLRLMPGTPFPFQNYLLGLARMPYGWYMLVSLPISIAIGTCFILFGDAIVKGDTGLVLLAVVLFLLLSILIRFARQRLKAKQIREEVE